MDNEIKDTIMSIVGIVAMVGGVIAMVVVPVLLLTH